MLPNMLLGDRKGISPEGTSGGANEVTGNPVLPSNGHENGDVVVFQ